MHTLNTNNMFNYYQAIELMDRLLLLNSFNINREEVQLHLNEGNSDTDNANILEMTEPWHLYYGLTQANGEYFVGE